MANKDTREEKDIIAQIVMLQMRYAFDAAKVLKNVDALYDLALCQKANRSHVYSEYMHKKIVDDKTRKKIINSFGFDSEVFESELGIFDYKLEGEDEKYNITSEQLKRLAFIEYNATPLSTRKWEYSSVKGGAKAAVEIENAIKEYVTKVMHQLGSKNKTLKGKAGKTNIGRFLIRIEAASEVSEDVADLVIEKAENFIQEYNLHKSYIVMIAQGGRRNSKQIDEIIRITKKLSSIQEELEAITKIYEMMKKENDYQF